MSNAFSDEFSNSAAHPVSVLNRANLPAIAAQGKVQTPSYDLDKRTASTVHFAFGNFAAAHIAVYNDDLLEKGVMNAGIIAVIPRIRIDQATDQCAALLRRDALQKQDYLYTVSERDRTTDRTRVIGSLMDIMVGPADRHAVYETLANPDIKLITGTVTQKGYDYDFKPEDKEDQFANYIVEGLALRFERGIEPFSVMSCDNIPNNSSKLKNLVITLAAQKNIPHFREWVANNVPFFDTMVDRITPTITEESRERIKSHRGIIDNEPISTEPYKELVVGVKKNGPQPPLPYDSVGATYTENPAAHELAKLRMLNGSHMFIGSVGRVAGEGYIEEALSKPALLARTQGFMAQVQATLDPMTERDLDAYAASLIERFRNPYPHDQLQRLARSGVDKVETRFVDPLLIAYQKGLPHDEIVSGLANWVVYLARANNDPTIPCDTEEGFYLEDRKAYDQGYIAAAKSLNGDISPMFSLPIFSRIISGQYGEIFKREIQQAYTVIVHPEWPNGLNPQSPNGNNGPSSPTVS